MALKHKIYNIRGVQFHPESIMTPLGKQILKNWLDAQQAILRERQRTDDAIAGERRKREGKL